MKNDANQFVRLQPDPISVAEAVAFVTHAEAGGIDIFLGTTRAEINKSGQPLLALDYEAYFEMALKQLKQLAHDAATRWPVMKIAVVHRLGIVAVGEPSVLIGVSTPHRAQAFEACRWVIDELKKDVAIWKKEVWGDGEHIWVHPGKGMTNDEIRMTNQ